MISAPLLALLAGLAAPPRHADARPVPVGSVVRGYLSPRGLPPRLGLVVVSDSGLVFRFVDGVTIDTVPLVGPVSLAYVEAGGPRPVYVFRVDGGVFTTEGPGSLLEVVNHPGRIGSPRSSERARLRPLVVDDDTAAIRDITRRVATSRYADTLYALFGRPQRPFGQVGHRGRRAGRLGEYVAGRDSLALDLPRMTGEDQLRHTMAHELGHRWQARAPAQLAVLWRDVPRIRDPKRYGYGNTAEHQAEAVAFAVHFLQTTSDPRTANGAALLVEYERMVPGTGVMARYLALQPIYGKHPLRRMLTKGEPG